jgi:drug/metabolite transporter (DMT)-like permease
LLLCIFYPDDAWEISYTSMQSETFKGAIFVFLSSILYGSYGVWSVLLGKDFGVFFQNYVRTGIVLLLVIPICFVTKSWQRIGREDFKYFFLTAAFSTCTQVPLYYAYQHAGIGITSIVLFSFALFTSFLFGKIFLGEQITVVKWISLVLGCIGLFLVFSDSFGAYSPLALVMAGLGGFAVGGQTASSKLIPKRFSAIQTTVIVWISGFAVCLPMSLFLSEKQITPALDLHWISMLIFAISGLFAFYFVIEGYKKIDASIGGLIGLLEVVFGIVFGVLIFQEAVTTNMVFGSMIIVIAASLPHIRIYQKKRSSV